ncbi:MAG: hypothetical protein LBK99_09120 [Opitutaceae bacterium]|jgi:hypothetical protein|nr:hypothetical protein [Opitutaceae bacterium]
MKIQIIHRILTVAGSLLLLPAVLVVPTAFAAQPFLSVDFNAGSGGPSPTQAGFVAINTGTGSNKGPLANTFNGLDEEFTATGSVTLTIARGNTITDGAEGDFTARDRGEISLSGEANADTDTFTYGDLYRDALQPAGSGSGGNGKILLEFSGLRASSAYEIRFFSYDANATNSRTMIFTDWTTGAAGDTSSITFTGGYAFTRTTDNYLFSTTITATTDASGKLLIHAAPDSSGSYGLPLNGLQLTAVPVPVPESAATTALMAAGAALGLATLLYRRAAHTGKN